MTFSAYAKINLFLEVCDKRADGFHNIDSVMQSVSLYDNITVEKNDIITLGNDSNLPNDESNLAYKAAKLFFEYSKINAGASVYIEKNIPISAGLAGGSTDAAAVLKALNILYNTEFSNEVLCKIGKRIGADVPFCIMGGCMHTLGIGEIMSPLAAIRDCFIVIAKDGGGVSTPEAYKNIDKSRNSDYKCKSSDLIISSLLSNDIKGVCGEMFNAFEDVVEPIRPEILKIKLIMNASNCIKAMMSGSGPSVFGIFASRDAANHCISELQKNNIKGHFCKPI